VKYIRARAPLRVSFIGGGTDLPSYYNEFGGAVLSGTINRYANVTIYPREDDQVCISSLDTDAMVKYRLDEKPQYEEALRLAQASIHRLCNGTGRFNGFDMTDQNDAPRGSGLGGSASMTVAVVTALKQLLGQPIDKYEIAELAYVIERSDLGISGGKQDQYEATFGGFNLIEFNRDGVIVNPLRLDRGLLSDLEYHCLLCYTGKTRPSMKVIDGLQEYIASRRPETVAGLKETRSLVYDMKNALLHNKLLNFAEMLDHAWQLKRAINPPVITDSTIDELYENARKNGAIGGKLLGAGAGGYLLLFCDGRKKRHVKENLERLGGQFLPFSFIDEGVHSWYSTCV